MSLLFFSLVFNSLPIWAEFLKKEREDKALVKELDFTSLSSLPTWVEFLNEGRHGTGHRVGRTHQVLSDQPDILHPGAGVIERLPNLTPKAGQHWGFHGGGGGDAGGGVPVREGLGQVLGVGDALCGDGSRGSGVCLKIQKKNNQLNYLISIN